MYNNTRIVSYDDSPFDAGSLLANYGISKCDITEDQRGKLVEYLEGRLLDSRSDAPGEFTVHGVTVTSTGHDAVGNLLHHYR